MVGDNGMTNKAVKYGIVGIAVVLFVAVAFAGAVSATITITCVDDWMSNLSTGSDIEEDVILDVPGGVLNFEGRDCYITSLKGTFEGNGCTIKNFNISRIGSDDVGLIGVYNGGSISNVSISDFSVSGDQMVGGLIGESKSGITFKNVSVMYGEITGSGCYVGVLVGSLSSGTVFIDTSCLYGCYLNGFVYVGGFVGRLSSGCYSFELLNSRVENCVIVSSRGYNGGCVGIFSYTSDYARTVFNCTVHNCVCYTQSSGDPCGGIIGGCSADGTSITAYPSVSDCTVEYCTLVGKGYSSVGGIAGNFPTLGTLARNKVISSCVVSVTEKAAGICPSAC